MGPAGHPLRDTRVSYYGKRGQRLQDLRRPDKTSRRNIGITEITPRADEMRWGWDDEPSGYTRMRGTTDWFRCTLHLDDQWRAQELVDVDNHKAVLRHLRAAMCPTTLMCTPVMWEAFVH